MHDSLHSSGQPWLNLVLDLHAWCSFHFKTPPTFRHFSRYQIGVSQVITLNVDSYFCLMHYIPQQVCVCCAVWLFQTLTISSFSSLGFKAQPLRVREWMSVRVNCVCVCVSVTGMDILSLIMFWQQQFNLIWICQLWKSLFKRSHCVHVSSCYCET